MIVNKYAKRCSSCNTMVGVGEGFAFNNNGYWQTVCASKACQRKFGVDAESQQKNQNRKEITIDGKVIMPFDREALPLLRSMPGARWNPSEKCWTASMKPGDLDRTLEIAEQLGLSIPDSLKKTAAEGTVDSQEAEKRASRVRVDGSPLYGYQKDGVRFLSLKDRALVGDDMGLGKTVQALVALPEYSKVIVVCPSAVKFNWRDEINLWRPDFSTKVMSGKKDDNIVPKNGEIVITNYDILPSWLIPTKDSGKTTNRGKPIMVADIPADKEAGLKDVIVIFDEIHLSKNFKSQRSQKVTSLCKVVAKVWGLTGTPLMNKPFDLWGVLCSLGMYPLGGFSKFIELFNGFQNRHGGYEFGMPKQEVVERIKRVMLRRLKSEVLKDLPPKTHQIIEVDCSSRAINKELNALAEKIADSQGISFDKADFSKLDLSVLPDFSEFSRVRAILAKAKIPAMLSMVEEYEEAGEPLVVFSDHLEPINELSKREGWAVITGAVDAESRRNIVAKFQSGDLKGIGLTIKAGGVGLTLTRASNMIFVDRNWTPSWNIQAEDRICRIGQKKNVLIKVLVSDHPLDTHMSAIIEKKIELAYRALDNHIEFQKKAMPEAQKTIDLVEETDEELAERIRLAEIKANEEYYREKIMRIAERESERVSSIPAPRLTGEKKGQLRGALSYLCSVCDGARKQDGMGFNKPDSCIGHWMNSIDLENADDEIHRVLERVLVRYRGQLESNGFDIWG